MAMPNNLILVRHGQSEGNVVTDSAKSGDESLYTPEFRETPGHQWRLTPEGRSQAEITGRWIMENIGNVFGRYYVSPYVRARETAALLGLPGAQWRVDQRLRERDWGEAGSIPRSQFEQEYPRSAQMRKIDSLYARLPGGESIADVRSVRVRSFFDTLHRECFGQNVIVVTHGEFMWATRAELEYMSDEQWVAADNDRKQRIHNAQTHHYSRLDPESLKQYPHTSFVRRITPYQDLDTAWLPIERHLFSNTQLLEQVAKIPPITPTE